MITDSSVILMAFFPDEAGQAQAQAILQAHALRRVELHAPSLLPYEIANAVLVAARRDRVSMETAEAILSAFEGLGISLHAAPRIPALHLARRFNRSAYDAAYLALAEAMDRPLVTADRRLFNALSPHWPRIQWIGDFRLPSD